MARETLGEHSTPTGKASSDEGVARKGEGELGIDKISDSEKLIEIEEELMELLQEKHGLRCGERILVLQDVLFGEQLHLRREYIRDMIKSEG